MPRPTKKVVPIGRFIGIDPGKSGGIAVLDFKGPRVFKMPDTPRDKWDLFQDVLVGSNVRTFIRKFAYVEKVSTSPQMGVKSAGTFMQGRGELLMALTAAGIPFEEVLPSKWIRGLGIPPRKKEETSSVWKGRLRTKAQQLFPDLDIKLWGADALLIAEYLRRVKTGEV